MSDRRGNDLKSKSLPRPVAGGYSYRRKVLNLVLQNAVSSFMLVLRNN